MASFSVNPVGSYASWPERQQENSRKKSREKTKQSSDEDGPGDEKEPRAETDGPVGNEIDIEV